VDDLPAFRPGSLIVDVSCDLAMGFSFARPTTFDEPTFVVGDGILYYGVDHTPSYLWNSATWEISNALIPFLGTALQGGPAWDADETLSRAIQIREGRVINSEILAFQGRDTEHPYRVA
jgi:alanine dehydrogenase